MPKIKIIVGSTRPGRFGIKAANWVLDIAKKRSDAEFELVDLKELDLPLLDESMPAAYGKYEHAHTKNFAKIIDDADGFVFVPAEYNHSVNAALTNAIAYVSAEWSFKPVTFVSYGAAAGGVRAVEHLRGLVANLNMYDLNESILLINYWTQLSEKGEFQPTEDQNNFVNAMLDRLVFWADQLKRGRAEQAAHAAKKASNAA